MIGLPQHDQMLIVHIDFTRLELRVYGVCRFGEIKNTQHFHLICGIRLGDDDPLLIHGVDVRSI
ncbi:hypothetical protein D3C85_1875010 [compost metagenome]